MEAALLRLRPHRAGGHTHLRAEHFKYWRREAYPGEQLKTSLQRERWLCLVDIVQNMWRKGDTPQELRWLVLVLIPKGTTNTQGIGLLETLWKVVEALIDTRLRSRLQMHDVLHGFRAGRGMGMDIMDLKLVQELASIDRDPLFLIFLDLSKSYDTVDWERLLITLFNVVVDHVIKTWLDMTVEDQRVYHDGLVETVGRCLVVFYDDNVMVGSCNPDWLQHATNVLVGLFRSYGLVANIAKSCTIICQPNALWTGMSEEAMALKCTGVGYSYRVRLRRRILCPECGVELTAGSMTEHCRRMHGTEPTIDWSQLPVSQAEHQPQVYNVNEAMPLPLPWLPGVLPHM